MLPTAVATGIMAIFMAIQVCSITGQPLTGGTACQPATICTRSGGVMVSGASAMAGAQMMAGPPAIQMRHAIVQPALTQPAIIQRIIQPVIQRIEQHKILQPIVQQINLPTAVKAAIIQPMVQQRSAMSEAAMLRQAFALHQYSAQIVQPTISKPTIVQPVVQAVIQPVETQNIIQPFIETVHMPTIVKAPIIEAAVATRPVMQVAQAAQVFTETMVPAVPVSAAIAAPSGTIIPAPAVAPVGGFGAFVRAGNSGNVGVAADAAANQARRRYRY